MCHTWPCELPSSSPQQRILPPLQEQGGSIVNVLINFLLNQRTWGSIGLKVPNPLQGTSTSEPMKNWLLCFVCIGKTVNLASHVSSTGISFVPLGYSRIVSNMATINFFAVYCSMSDKGVVSSLNSWQSAYLLNTTA